MAWLRLLQRKTVAKTGTARTGVGMAAPAAKRKAVAKTGIARVTPTCDHDAARGVIDGARAPLHYGESKIYTAMKLMRYRVYKKKSDKIEVNFGWTKAIHG